MSNHYEKLLARDPIGAVDKMKSNYLRYFKTAYSVRDEKVDKERMAALENGNNLFKPPYLEMQPEYASMEGVNGIDDARIVERFIEAFVDKTVCEQFFSQFIKKGLMKYTPYGHQMEMMEQAFTHKRNAVITSGTGSGKTESFLLPLLADLFKEAKTWGKPNYDRIDWYNHTRVSSNRTATTEYEPCQREGENRTAAVRAILLYPMNALVEDQIARLREALDSDDVRSFFDKDHGLKGNRIYFGKYTGQTPGSKSVEIYEEDDNRENAYKKQKENLHDTLAKLHDGYSAIKALPDEERKDAQYITTRLDDNSRTAEMVTRWDMQKWAPDIMVTNSSMLSVMLMRKAEKKIFDDTRAWLQADESHVFHLVVDELHLYRDTAGSEVACLVRMLLKTLGFGEDNGPRWSQLRILTSSASLGGETETQDFLQDFFGVHEEEFVVVNGSDYTVTPGKPLDYSIFEQFAPGNEYALDELNAFATEQGYNDLFDFVEANQNTIYAGFKDALKKPVAYDELYGEGKLFPTKAAARGFLIFRAAVDVAYKADDQGRTHHLPRIRFHQFFRYIEGLWGELLPEEGKVVGNLSYTPEEVGPSSHKVLELLRCECCGELFIGGNRKVGLNNAPTLMLNHPNLDQIPSSNPTPMIQNKSYQDYALFWPTESTAGVDLDTDEERRVVDLRTGKANQNHGNAVWLEGHLDAVTGSIAIGGQGGPNKIHGYCYSINGRNHFNDAARFLQAMPCCCPHCRQNYQGRKYTKSPIRSFRTGINRTNQLLSKELMYQLPDNSRKLIGFSDSREDAANQALGIEKEHYRDMVRMLFVECVKEKEDIINIVTEEINRLRAEGLSDDQIEEDHIDDEKGIFADKTNRKLGNKILKGQDVSSYVQREIPLTDFVETDMLNGRLVEKLLKLGINPAGVGQDVEYYDHIHHWSNAFEFTSNGDDVEVAIRHRGIRSQPYKDKTQANLETAVFQNSFGRYMGLSMLDSGIGYICCKRTLNGTGAQAAFDRLKAALGLDDSATYDFVDDYIRILGDYYRYPNDEFNSSSYNNYGNWPNNLTSAVVQYAQIHNLDANEIGNALYNFMAHHDVKIIADGTLLQFNNLAFHKMNEGDPYYRCPMCRRIHLARGLGFCTNAYCQEPLVEQPTGTVAELRQDHFISFDILRERREPCRIHTEELSGQTDNIQDRLLEFKDIILAPQNEGHFLEGYKRTKAIDMLNVTTTMEVGVDIGSLTAVFQGNMPPTRYNYQQRVGRGGRRGQAFSAAITCCRGRSHDAYYYDKATDEMIGGTPAPPRLSLRPYTDNNRKKMKQAIMKRVIVKHLFRDALGTSMYDFELNDTAGEFGRVNQWDQKTRPRIAAYLNDTDTINNLVETYFAQYNQNGEICGDIDELTSWLHNGLLVKIDEMVRIHPENSNDGLAECMAEWGLLPMYGLPSDSRKFYHGFKNSELRTIDRPSHLAISEFSIGSEKTKDKGKFKVEALTTPLLVVDNHGRGGITIQPAADNDDALGNRFILQKDNEGNITGVTSCTDGQDAIEIGRSLRLRGTDDRLLVLPKAYRSLKIKDNYGKEVDNNERKSTYCPIETFAQDDSTSNNTISLDNVKLSVYGLSLSDTSEVWHINTKDIEGSYSEIGENGKPNVDNLDHHNFISYKDNMDLDNVIKVNLGDKKTTEMVKIELKEDVYANVDLRLTKGNKSAIKAAFYSAAFLIQRALADKLDVQPEDIEVSAKFGVGADIDHSVIYLNDALPNGASLVSYLYHDNHLEEILREIAGFESPFMKSFLSDEHKHNCRTACHKCLMTYSNRGFHHVLDWRLGVGIINLMLDRDYDFGYTVAQRNNHKELFDFDELMAAAAKKLDKDDTPVNWMWQITDGLEQERQVVYHPMWRKRLVATDTQNFRYSIYNTFKLLRSDRNQDEIPDDPIYL